jgi:hypothetical protein
MAKRYFKRKCPAHKCYLSRCGVCAAAGVQGAGTDLCMRIDHRTKKGGCPRKFACSRCIADGFRVARTAKTQRTSEERHMLICDFGSATGNVGGKGYEVKKKCVSEKQGYGRLTGPVVQAVRSSVQYIDCSSVNHPTENMTLSTARPQGKCAKCVASYTVDHPSSYAVQLPEIVASTGLQANWVLGTISFEPDNHVDLFVPRKLRGGFSEEETCACAWEYDTRCLDNLFLNWRPRNGEKRACIAFLAHYAWTTSRGTAMAVEDEPGRLRAHKIVAKERFTKRQVWTTPAALSGCSLRWGARRHAARP